MDSSLENVSQAQRERLAFLEFRAYFLGEVRRTDLIARFGIKTAAATRDIALYKEIAKDNLIQDQKSKAYLPAETFVLQFEHSAERVLTALTKGFGEGMGGGAKAPIPSEVPRLLNLPAIHLLAPITRAIHRKKAVKIVYSSFTSGENAREIAPFALANNGLRWHVRAYDRLKKGFRDFVLTRVSEPEFLDGSEVEEHEDPVNDLEWSRIVELDLVPHPRLKSKDQAIVAMDYGMPSKDRVLKVRVRAALVGYFLRQWSVDCSEEHELSSEEIRLWLSNSRVLYAINNAVLAPGYSKEQPVK
jgi:hypothetical protein